MGRVRTLRKHLGAILDTGVHERPLRARWYENIIQREADLAGIARLDCHDPSRRFGEIELPGHDHRRFAPAFQGHGRQIVRRGAHHMLRATRGAGEDQMVEGTSEKIAALPSPPSTVLTSFGENASPMSDASRSEKRGVNSDGFRIARLPAARIPASGLRRRVIS